MATVYQVSNIPLPISEVIKVLQDPPEVVLSSSTLPPVKPKVERSTFTNQLMNVINVWEIWTDMT